MSCSLFGRKCNAPFGIDPVELQGLMWPGAPEILAKYAKENNISFLLSTVAASSIERIDDAAEGNMWFQLYHPVEQGGTDYFLLRLDAVGVDAGCFMRFASLWISAQKYSKQFI